MPDVLVTDKVLVVELPEGLPVLTPGLACALRRVIVKAARRHQLVRVRDNDDTERIAS